MSRSIVFRIISALVLIAALAGIAFFAFNAGVAHGVAANVQVQAGESGGQPYPYYGYGMPFWRPIPFFEFGFFGLLIPLFLFFLVFGAFRRLIWGPRWGWHHMHRRDWGGPMGYGPGGESVPPMFAEWHRRAHGEEPKDEKSE